MKNDYFQPIRFEGVFEATLTLFNRWGQKVATLADPLVGWDGTFNGQVCSDGIYFWALRYTTINNEAKEQNGLLELIR